MASFRFCLSEISPATSEVVISGPGLILPLNIVYSGWENVELSLTQILYLLCVMLAAFPASGFLTSACDLLNND